jgi:hypothetical protein
MASRTKLSIHSSGICRLANVEGFDYSWDRDHDPRVLHRWTIEPVGGESDLCVCLSLIVPTIYVHRRVRLDVIPNLNVERVRWINPAPLGFGTTVDLLRARSDGIPLPELINDAGYEVIGSLPLRSGAVVWVIRRQFPLAAKDLDSWQRELAEAKFTMSGPGQRWAFGSITSAAKHPHPAIRDVALGWENFIFED